MVKDAFPVGSIFTFAYVALGSNRGDRAAHLRYAVAALDATTGVTVETVSPVYRTEAHTMDPEETQPDYLNAVVGLRTLLDPDALLDVAQRIEADRGRLRDRRWAPRTLDVDVLVVGDDTRDGERLTLPHPRLADRRFVLQPFADIAPNLTLPPPFDAAVKTLLARCPDSSPVERTDVQITTRSS